MTRKMRRRAGTCGTTHCLCTRSIQTAPPALTSGTKLQGLTRIYLRTPALHSPLPSRCWVQLGESDLCCFQTDAPGSREHCLRLLVARQRPSSPPIQVAERIHACGAGTPCAVASRRDFVSCAGEFGQLVRVCLAPVFVFLASGPKTSLASFFARLLPFTGSSWYVYHEALLLCSFKPRVDLLCRRVTAKASRALNVAGDHHECSHPGRLC